MTNIILFPFRLIAFLLRVILWIIFIPLIIIIRILGLAFPELANLLSRIISGFINIFKF